VRESSMWLMQDEVLRCGWFVRRKGRMWVVELWEIVDVEGTAWRLGSVACNSGMVGDDGRYCWDAACVEMGKWSWVTILWEEGVLGSAMVIEETEWIAMDDERPKQAG